jgi:hypothetical protein
MTYKEKLLDPRWQRKRLEILQRADFKCEVCGDGKKTLHVHHGYYERGFDPWDYDNETLNCLCDPCHQAAQERLRDLHFELAKIGPKLDSEAMLALLCLKSAKFLDADGETDRLGLLSISELTAYLLFRATLDDQNGRVLLARMGDYLEDFECFLEAAEKYRREKSDSPR